MEIIIDFDGTVVEHQFPEIGREVPGAVIVLSELVYKGHALILFTMRSDVEAPISNDQDIICKPGKYLTEAVQWFRDRYIPLYGIQTNPTQHLWTSSPKAYGQLIIDDTAIGIPLIYPGNSKRPFVDWVKVRDLLVDMNILDPLPF